MQREYELMRFFEGTIKEAFQLLRICRYTFLEFETNFMKLVLDLQLKSHSDYSSKRYRVFEV